MQDYLYAGFWRRFWAFLIDSCIIAAVYIVGIVICLRIVGLSPMDIKKSRPILHLMGLIFNWPYYASMESSEWQATLGKRAWGIVVTDLDGQRISFGRATGRYFGKILSGLILGIGYFMIAFTSKKQALHDMMAGTLVVVKTLASAGTGKRLEPIQVEAKTG